MKPPDSAAVPLCHTHHTELHQGGAETFERTHNLDLARFAQEFAAVSPALSGAIPL